MLKTSSLLMVALGAYLVFKATSAQAQDNEIAAAPDGTVDDVAESFKPSQDDTMTDALLPSATTQDLQPVDAVDAVNLDVQSLASAVADYLKPVEGFRSYVYDDANGKPWAQSQRGNPTIGYGHLLQRSDDMTMQWSEDYANQVLIDDVMKHMTPLIAAVTVPLSVPAWTALVSLAFNAGAAGVVRSNMLKALNAGDMAKAQANFLDWSKATVKQPDGTKVKVTMPGLLARRQREWAMIEGNPTPVVYLA